MTAEARLANLDLTLPAAPGPKGNYRPIVQIDRLAFLAGHLPIRQDGSLITGRLGADMDIAAGAEAARVCGLNLLATLREHLGTLDRVARVVRVFGVIACSDDFTQQPAVLNGCSDLIVDIFGTDAGVGVRAAVGTNALPLGAAVEIEAVFQVRA